MKKLLFIFTLSAVLLGSPFSWATPHIDDMKDNAICQKIMGAEYDTVIQLSKTDGSETISCVLDGKTRGPFSSFHPNGKLKSQGLMNDDKLEGFWTRWYSTGAIESQGTWDESIPDGHWVFYYPNGQKKEEGYFQKGKKYCEWAHWSTEGTSIDRPEADCLPIFFRRQINLRTRGSYSKHSITDRDTGIETILMSGFEMGLHASFDYPLRQKFNLSLRADLKKTTLKAGAGGKSLSNAEHTIFNWGAGVRYPLTNLLHVQVDFYQNQNLVLQNESFQSVRLETMQSSQARVQVFYEFLQLLNFDVWIKGHAAYQFSHARLGSGKSWGIEAEGFFKLSRKLQLAASAYYSQSDFSTDYSENSVNELGLSAGVQIRL